MSARPISKNNSLLNRRVLVIGLGNSDRSDDGIGLVIAKRLTSLVPEGVTVTESGGDLMTLLDTWRAFEDVILIDAMHAGDMPGRVRWFDVSAEELPEDSFHSHSTHAFGLAHAVAMARALGDLPPRIHVVGIQGAVFAPGTTLSPVVQAAVNDVVKSVLVRLTVEEITHA